MRARVFCSQAHVKPLTLVTLLYISSLGGLVHHRSSCIGIFFPQIFPWKQVPRWRHYVGPRCILREVDLYNSCFSALFANGVVWWRFCDLGATGGVDKVEYSYRLKTKICCEPARNKSLSRRHDIVTLFGKTSRRYYNYDNNCNPQIVLLRKWRRRLQI